MIHYMENTKSEAGPAVGQITLAGGCFWGIEAGFRGVTGILATMVGYTGGDVEHPDYSQVSTGKTGHVEAVRIAYDPAIISLHEILRRFFSMYDPTSGDGQHGYGDSSQYRSFIFCHTEEDCRTARAFIREEEASGMYKCPVVTAVRSAEVFWPAEDYHQQYFEKLGNRYRKPLF
jgi:peptide-methionine (S)-S-oxide reductase